MDRRFIDQVAIITGAADGLGKAIAQRIAGEGGAVAIFDINETTMETVSYTHLTLPTTPYV